MLLRHLLVSSAVALATAVLPVVASAESVIKFVMQSDVKVIDPVWSGAYITRDYGYMVYDTLFSMDAQFQVKPQMVDTWKESDDGLTWTFTLRDGLEWHDGKPVTAEDCVASLKRWSVRDSMGQKLASYLSEYKVVDTKTFQIVLKQKFGPMLEALGKPSVIVPFMMPKRVADTDPFTQISDATGSGPFILKKDEWRPGEKIVFLKNPEYKPRPEPMSGMAGGKRVLVDRVEWVWIPDPETQVNALISGEIDGIQTVGFDYIPLLEQTKSVKLLKNPFPNQFLFRPNWMQPPLNNQKVRQAVSVALSQPEILEANIGDKRFYRTCKALFTCDSPFASTVGMDGLIDGNVARAKELLKEAGYDGTPILMMQPTDLGVVKQIAPVVQAQLAKVGIKVEVVPMDFQSMATRGVRKGPVSEGGWNAFGSSWSQVDILDPLMTPALIATCEKARPGWPCDEKLERLRDAFVQATTPEDRKKTADAVQAYAMQVVTHVPLGEWYGVSAVRNNIAFPEPLSPVIAFWGVSKK